MAFFTPFMQPITSLRFITLTDCLLFMKFWDLPLFKMLCLIGTIKTMYYKVFYIQARAANIPSLSFSIFSKLNYQCSTLSNRLFFMWLTIMFPYLNNKHLNLSVNSLPNNMLNKQKRML